MGVLKTISLKGEALQVDVDRLREIAGGSVLAEAIQRSTSHSTGSWTEYTKHTDSPPWSDYSAHAKTIK